MIIRQYFICTVICAVILPSAVLRAQEQPTFRERAEALFQRYEYARAADFYTRLVDRAKEPSRQDLQRIAESYYRMRDFGLAEMWYGRVVAHTDHTEADILKYADVLKANGKYEEAKNWYQRYADQTGLWDDVTVQIAGCDSSLLWRSAPSGHVIRNEEQLNTSGSEFSAFPIDGKIWYVGEPTQHPSISREAIYGWTGRPFLKIHRADLGEDQALVFRELLGVDLNGTPYHVGPVASPDAGETLYVTRTVTRPTNPNETKRERTYREHRLELYTYAQQNRKWVPTPFAHNESDKYSVGHATFSEDGQIIYFVSDRPGGAGGTDIWYAERQSDGSWGEPRNAGTSINTAGDELFPMMGPDGHLYYATDGLPGMGGLDIFQSRGSKESWSQPRNMGFPVNSSGDDFAYVVTWEGEKEQRGYFSSNRSGGKGGDDIYSFAVQSTPGALAGARPGKVEPGRFGRLDSTGIKTMEVKGSDTSHVAVVEPELSVGKTFTLENLYYDFDKHEIRPDAARVLDQLLETMREYPTLKIELSSHTDSRGNEQYNLALSQRRAQAAVDYLVGQGIARSRIIAKGYGETRLINACGNDVDCTEEQHQQNRRTEVTVLEL